MATYNGGQFIASQLRSILSQLSPEDEVVISDDSSTDDTLAIIESFSDDRIRLFKNQTFCSPIYNFEHALKQSRGDIIFLSDQDDEWVEGWVEAALATLRVVSLVVCEISFIDAEGSPLMLPDATTYKGNRRSGVLHNLYRNDYMGCSCAFRRNVLEAALPFPAKLPWHDWWIGLVADAFFKTRFIRSRFIRHRRHGGNASATGGKSNSTSYDKILMRWRIATALAWRLASKRRAE